MKSIADEHHKPGCRMQFLEHRHWEKNKHVWALAYPQDTAMKAVMISNPRYLGGSKL